MNGAFYVPPLTVLPVFADEQPRRESPKTASRPFQFFRECVHKFGMFCPEVRRRTRDGAFIYALSADETSPALAAPRHAITALFSCCFKCPCPTRRQPHFRSNADRAYNTLHFASKVVCQRDTLWKPRTTKQAEYLALSRCLILSLYLLSTAPVSWSACSSL